MSFMLRCNIQEENICDCSNISYFYHRDYKMPLEIAQKTIIRKVATLALLASFAGEAAAIFKHNAEGQHDQHGNRREMIERTAARLRESENCGRHGRRRPKKYLVPSK
jgi:hypothetical protein